MTEVVMPARSWGRLVPGAERACCDCLARLLVLAARLLVPALR